MAIYILEIFFFHDATQRVTIIDIGDDRGRDDVTYPIRSLFKRTYFSQPFFGNTMAEYLKSCLGNRWKSLSIHQYFKLLVELFYYNSDACYGMIDRIDNLIGPYVRKHEGRPEDLPPELTNDARFLSLYGCRTKIKELLCKRNQDSNSGATSSSSN